MPDEMPDEEGGPVKSFMTLEDAIRCSSKPSQPKTGVRMLVCLIAGDRKKR
jgi:hypothetical protein